MRKLLVVGLNTGPSPETNEDTVTLEDLENTLPNGLHDAEVHKLSVDHVGPP